MPKNNQDTNKQYIIIVLLLTFIIPMIGCFAEHVTKEIPLTFNLFGKWFIFSAVGLRLFLAGIRQTTNPAFTAKTIFHINSEESYPILRELGYANLCFGLVAIVSLFAGDWRVVSAFASGLYYGMAGIQHLIKKPAGTNEAFALWTDLMIFMILVVYFIYNIWQ